MKKNKKLELLNKIKENDIESCKYLNTYLLTNALLKLFFVVLLLVFSILMESMVTKLSYISPKAFIITSIVFIVILVIFISLILYNKFVKDDSINPKLIYKMFDLYDFISFIGLTIQVIFFIILFVITPTTVSGLSMNNSFSDGDKLLVWHLGYSPKKDDVVILDINSNYNYQTTDKFFIKRVVATEGDVLYYKYETNDFYVNDELVQTGMLYSEFNTLREYKSDTNISANPDNDYKVPEGYIVVLGDNRSNSVDSRRLGLIKKEDVLGHVIFRIYSPDKKNFGVPKKYLLHN